MMMSNTVLLTFVPERLKWSYLLMLKKIQIYIYFNIFDVHLKMVQTLQNNKQKVNSDKLSKRHISLNLLI